MALADLCPEFLRALCIWREARNTPDAWRPVWFVIENRAHSGRPYWRSTVDGVILQPLQFSSFNKGNPMSLLFPIDGASADSVAWQAICHLCDVQILGSGADPTNGANAYHTETDPAKYPDWATADKLVLTVETFKFYKL